MNNFQGIYSLFFGIFLKQKYLLEKKKHLFLEKKKLIFGIFLILNFFI